MVAARRAPIRALPSTPFLTQAVPHRARLRGAQLFDEVWSDVDANYVFFQLGGIDWNAALVAYRDSVIDASHDETAARLLGAMLLRLHDHHVALVTESGIFDEPLPAPADFVPPIVPTIVPTIVRNRGEADRGEQDEKRPPRPGSMAAVTVCAVISPRCGRCSDGDRCALATAASASASASAVSQ